MNKIQYGSIVVGVGLVGLAVYQFSTADFAGGVQSVFAALAAFGVLVNNRQHEELKLKLQRRGFIHEEPTDGKEAK